MRKIINIHGHLHKEQDVDKKVEEWKSQGVVKYCILAVPRHLQTMGLLGNEDVKKWMDKHPDFIVGMGGLELGRNMDRPTRVKELYEEGFQGLKFIMPMHNYSDERYFGFYDMAQSLKMPILFHTGWVTVSDKQNPVRESDICSEYMRPYHFDRICREFPDLKIIGAHLGNPHYNEALCVMEQFRNVYYDVTGGSGSRTWLAKIKYALGEYYKTDVPEEEQEILEQRFNKLCFGTDNPPVPLWIKNSDELLDHYNISEETRENFYWKNAAKIFGWTNI